MRICAALLCFLMTAALPAAAESPTHIGTGRLFTNDYFGDGRDRWQSGSYVISHLRSPAVWTGAPHEFGVVTEYRLRSSVMASDGQGDAPGDRPYAGTISFGVHSHYGVGTTQSRIGMDVTVTGPQTQVSGFQRRVHELLDMRQARFTDSQLGDGIYFGISAETAEIVQVSDAITMRPFAEAQVGPEDLFRIGADVFFGGGAQSDLMIRDVTTGHLYQGTKRADWSGVSFVIGGDLAFVADSIFLPDTGQGARNDTRGRLRVGARWHGQDNTGIFYGLTYLSPEFANQSEGQITGSLQLNFNF